MPACGRVADLRRGFLYWAQLDKRRPVLVVSPDYRNDRASDVIVVPASTTLRPAPTHVRLRAGEGGVERTSVLQCEQIVTLPRGRLDVTALGGPLSATRMDDVLRGILLAVGAHVSGA